MGTNQPHLKQRGRDLLHPMLRGYRKALRSWWKTGPDRRPETQNPLFEGVLEGEKSASNQRYERRPKQEAQRLKFATTLANPPSKAIETISVTMSSSMPLGSKVELHFMIVLPSGAGVSAMVDR